MLEALFLNHSLFLHSFWRIFENKNTSRKSAMAKAVRLAAAIRADSPKTASYAFSEGANREEGGRLVAKREKRRIRRITNKPDRIMLRIRAAPYTSVMTSLIEKIRGITKIATLALS